MQKARRHPEGLRPLVSVWFQVLFHSAVRGSFHLSLTVLVHYRSLGSIQPYRMVPVDSDRISRVPPYSGYYHIQTNLHLRGYHPLWLNFPVDSVSQFVLKDSPTTPTLPKQYWFGLVPFRSPLLWKSLLFSFPLVNQMFQFTRLAPLRVTGLQPVGLPHSEITGSIGICPFPMLIAAYHVLLRLQEPRHPPYALIYFL